MEEDKSNNGNGVPEGGNGNEPRGGASWLDGLSDELKGSSVLRKYDSQESALKALIGAQELIGRKGLQSPDEGASAEEISAYRKARRNGIQTPAGYKEPSGMSAEDLSSAGLTPEVLEGLRSTAFELGLDADGYRAFVTRTAKGIAEQREAVAEAMSARAEELRGKLSAEWGDSYAQRCADGRALMEEAGIFESAKNAGLLLDENFVRFIDEAVKAVKREGSIPKISRGGESPRDVIAKIRKEGTMANFRNPEAQRQSMEAYAAAISKMAAAGRANGGRIVV